MKACKDQRNNPSTKFYVLYFEVEKSLHSCKSMFNKVDEPFRLLVNKSSIMQFESLPKHTYTALYISTQLKATKK